MNVDQINAHIAALSDDELVKRTDEAYADNAQAAATQKDSEWHQACFAALHIYCAEMGKRGLTIASITREGAH